MGNPLQSEQAAGCALLLEAFEELALRGFALAIDKDAATNLVRRGGSGLAGTTNNSFVDLEVNWRSNRFGSHELGLQNEKPPLAKSICLVSDGKQGKPR
jgi:hypothetical protein